MPTSDAAGNGTATGVRVIAMVRARDEAALIGDTLDHLARFANGGIVALDDCSTDETPTIMSRHPNVSRLHRNEAWDDDRLRAEYADRARLLELAREIAGPDDWLVYVDADERLEFDWTILPTLPADVIAVRMKLFDYYITPEDVGRRYDERRWIGPEYRGILMAFRNLPTLSYSHPDQREVELGCPGRVLEAGSVRHYGKATTVEAWERKCEYYARHFPPYAAKWDARRGRAVHTASDFGAPLIRWDERFEKGYPLGSPPSDPATRPLRVLVTNHQLIGDFGSETYTLTLARTLRRLGHDVVVYTKFAGHVVARFRRDGIPVVTDLEEVRDRPFDVVHAHHVTCALEVRRRFPALPVVFVSHGVLPFLESPPAVDAGITRFVAVSEEVRTRLRARLDRLGVPSPVALVPNFVDEDAFAPRVPAEPVLRRVFVNSNKIDDAAERTLRDAAERLGVSLWFAGQRFGTIANDELRPWLEDAQVVVSLGRGAIEAMMCGRVPLVFDRGGADGLVTPETLDEIARCNFSSRRFGLQLDAAALAAELARYTPEAGAALRAVAVERFGATAQVGRLVAIYREAMSDPAPRPLEGAAAEFATAVVESVSAAMYQAAVLAREAVPAPTSAAPDDPLDAARRAMARGWPNAARASLERLDDARRDDLDAIELFAAIEQERGDYRAALEWVRRVAERDQARGRARLEDLRRAVASRMELTR